MTMDTDKCFCAHAPRTLLGRKSPWFGVQLSRYPFETVRRAALVLLLS